MHISESRKSFIFLYLRMEKVSLKKQYNTLRKIIMF
jgi:hypothetical protein